MTERKLTFFGITCFLIAAVIVGCGPAVSELSGTIQDTDGQAVSDAVVQLDSLTATSDAGGSFVFPDLDPGTYTLTVEAAGKLKKQQTVELSNQPVAVQITLEDEPLPAGCEPRDGDPADIPLVYCQPITADASLQSLGWHVGSGDWIIAEDGDEYWIQGTSNGEQQYVYTDIPQLANAKEVIVEYTAMYLPGGNTWAMQMLADNEEQAHGANFMILSAWDGIYIRRYEENEAIMESTIIAPPNVMPREIVTIRVAYDHEAKTIDLTRNGQRPPEFPATLHDDFLLQGPDQTLLKLYVNVGGDAGDTTALFKDIRVWAR